MIMNGEYGLEGVGHSPCEGAALPFIWQGWCKPEKHSFEFRDCYNLHESLQSLHSFLVGCGACQ